jgi:hypothetical protein
LDMKNNQFKNILLIILVIAVAYLGYKLFVKVPPKEEAKPAPVQTVFDWKSLSKNEIETIVSKEPDVYFEKDIGLSLTQEVDLTGDGKPEAIVNGNGGNNEVSFILYKNREGNVSVAKLRNKNGELSPATLLEIGRVMVNASYKLLPSENGFYTSSLEFDDSADNSETSHFKCGEDSVNAFAWNSQKEWFEWNKALTDKYTVEVCK